MAGENLTPATIEAILRALLDHVGDGIVVFDPSFRCMLWNHQMERITGVPAEQAQDRNIFDVLPFLADVGEDEYLYQALAGRVVIGADRPYRAGYYDVRYFPIRSSDGSITGAIGVLHDVTSRRIAEVESEQRNALALEIASALARSGGLKVMLGRCTDAMSRRLDGVLASIWTSEKQGAGLQLRATSGPDDQSGPAMESLVNRIARDGRSYITNNLTSEPEPLDPLFTGDAGFIAFAGLPLKVEQRVIGVLALFSRQAITEQRSRFLGFAATVMAQAIERTLAQEKSAQVEARNTAILNAALDAVVVIDQHGTIVDFNPAAEVMFGYSKDDVAGQSMAGTIIPGSLREAHRLSFKRHLATGEAKILGKRLELSGLRRGGQEFPIELVVSRVDVNEHVLFAAHIRDISERKAFEERLMHDAQDLARANSDLQQFAYVTSHDLQEPLRTISSYVDLLNRAAGPVIPTEAQDYLEFIKEGARRMDALVQDLLLFARVSNQEVELKPVDMSSALDWALQNLEIAIEESGAVITRDSLPEVVGSRVHLVQLFQNLIGNSIKYRSEEPPRIHVSAAQEGSEWVFSVKDNGIGIAREQHLRIFEIFKRLHGRSVPGTGIGLAVCKRIAERHGGRIWVESEPGEGAEFKFTLPAL